MALDRFGDAPVICLQNQGFHSNRLAGGMPLLTMMNQNPDDLDVPRRLTLLLPPAAPPYRRYRRSLFLHGGG